ncbi:hypothetical protein AXF42_Ash019958 [Apostasia shenzhenica]|uniref:Uncharacterized protein n=1 Tax=Apostasia shenzhenica TaxID=1088818 RepID=A0A2I0AZK4_9ASPA|nr:hypothetical protein AXF42_Ash019958 [Apostasia shenzhenica]
MLVAIWGFPSLNLTGKALTSFVREIAGPNAYHLMTSEGIQLPRTWSGDDLKKFYA